MAYKDYDGLEIDKAIEKLKAKSFHDEEDKAFARSRADHFSPEELRAITGDEFVETPGSNDADATPGNAPVQTPATVDAPDSPEGINVIDPKKSNLDVLQGIAAEAGLDTSGTKAELADRINAFRAANAAKDPSITEPSPQKEGEADTDPLKAGTPENDLAKNQ